MSGGDLPPSNSFSVGQQQLYQNHDAGNHIFQSPTHVAFKQSERKGTSQEDQFTTGVNSQAQSAYKEMNPATRGYQAPHPGHWPTPPGQQNYSDHSSAVNHAQSQSLSNSLGLAAMNIPLKRSPLSNAMSNGPVATLPQGHPHVGSPPATNASLPPASVGSSPRLSAPLSPGAALTNGPSSQLSASAIGNNIQAGFSQPGSAFSPVTPSQSTYPPQKSSPMSPVSGVPLQGQLNTNTQSQQTYIGQNKTPPPPSNVPLGQDAGQISGMLPTSAPQVTQPLSALHSNKPKRPVMPMNTAPGFSGPSPRSAPPPPGPAGSANSPRSTPPPPSNLPGSGMPPVSYNSPATGFPPVGQDSSAGTRPISSRRRMYPAQTSPPSMPGVPAGIMNVPGQSNQYPGQMPTAAQQQMSTGPSPSRFPSQGSGLEGPMGRLSVQQPSGCQPVNLMEQRHILPTTPLEQPIPNLASDLPKRSSDPSVLCCTLNAVPETKSLLTKSKLPLGIHLHPFRDLQNLPVIHSTVITRCRSCRTYINPFVTFTDARRWRCPMCFRVNEVPEEFCFDPQTRQYGDPSKRPEIRNATVEFIAPSEYMLRPPQPSVFLFLLDVSFNALETGYLQLFCKLLKDNLDKMPGDLRTQIGFITFDSTVHFYSLKPKLNQPQMHIVSDLDDVFLPSPDDLLVNLNESKELVIQLLDSLPALFSKCPNVHSATGAALQAALKLVGPIGGRITLLQTTLPNIGPGELKRREDGQKSSPKDVQNLSPATDFYKKFALDCAAEQVAVDIFLLSGQYADIASLMCASKYSGGSVTYYPDFHVSRNPAGAEKFENEFIRYLTRKIGFEAVMRVRCTKGLSIHTFHGNFFVRSTDLVSLPNVSPDSGFSMQIDIEDTLTDSNIAVFQSALLYTSSKGERRIRVHTLGLPITNKLADLYATADVQAIATLLAKMAVDRTLSSSLGDAREALMNACIDALSVFRTSVANQPQSSGLIAPYSLRLLPLFILAIMKHMAFRLGSSRRLDERCFAMQQLKVMPLNLAMLSIYPKMYPIHDLSDEGAVQTKSGLVAKPPIFHLSGEKLSRKGIFLMDTGHAFYVWVGRDAPIDVIQPLFGVANFTSIPDNLGSLPVLENPLSERVRTFIDYLQLQRTCHANIYVIREDSRMRMLFLQNLVDDRSESVMSYYEFLVHLQKQISK
ncbi:protein transport protein Sec24A-like [Montipora foliosa]|uniref:protein transport protein Sec24A-like n=1 Tax=Montipora foliosa TaxID=591990 RepID=UPI0035F1A913